MPSINTLIEMIKNGDTTEVNYFSIPEEERYNKSLMDTLISFLEADNRFDTLDIPVSRLTSEQQQRIAVLILTKPNLRHLSLVQWKLDDTFLKAIIKKPLLTLQLHECGPLDSMSSIIAGTNTLEDLYVSCSSFSDIDIENIKQIKTLKKFHCSSNQFSVKSLMELICLNQFEELNFDEENVTADDIKSIQDAIKDNTRLVHMAVKYKNALDEQDTTFIYDKRPMAKKQPKIKIDSIMDTSSSEVERAIDEAFSMQSGERLRLTLLELGYSPNTYIDVYYKRNEKNPVLNCEIANEEHEYAIKIIEAFPELDPTMTDWGGKNALHIACKSYTADKVVLALIQKHLHKLDLNAQDKRGCTPLHYLCAYGKLELVKKLTQLGSKLDIKDKLGKTPLDYAQLPIEKVAELLDSIAICPFRDTKASHSINCFMLPDAFIDSDISYSPFKMSSVVCLENVQESLTYITSDHFKETYPNQKAEETKRLQELATTLSGKSVIKECMENQAKVLSYLSTFKDVVIDGTDNFQAGAPLITHSYEHSKSSKLYGALAVGTATLFALKLLTSKR